MANEIEKQPKINKKKVKTLKKQRKMLIKDLNECLKYYNDDNENVVEDFYEIKLIVEDLELNEKELKEQQEEKIEYAKIKSISEIYNPLEALKEKKYLKVLKIIDSNKRLLKPQIGANIKEILSEDEMKGFNMDEFISEYSRKGWLKKEEIKIETESTKTAFFSLTEEGKKEIGNFKQYNIENTSELELIIEEKNATKKKKKNPIKSFFKSLVIFIGLFSFLFSGAILLQYSGIYDIFYQIEKSTNNVGEIKGLAEGTLRSDFSPQRGDYIGKIYVPRVNLEATIMNEFTEVMDDPNITDVVALDKPGFFPGDRKQVYINGHRNEVFQLLKDVTVGDLIIIDMPYGVFTYRIDNNEVVKETDVWVQDIEGKIDNFYDELKLQTCYPFNAGSTTTERMIYTAHRIEDVYKNRTPEENSKILNDVFIRNGFSIPSTENKDEKIVDAVEE